MAAAWKAKKNKIIEVNFDKSWDAASENKVLKAVFGVVTDIQYADCNDRPPKNGKPIRHYRNGLNLLDDACAKWKLYEAAKTTQLSCVVQLGDFIDRRSRKPGHRKAMDSVLARLQPLASPERTTKLLHVWGNHDLDCFKRCDLLSTPLNSSRLLYGDAAPCATANYYSFEVTANLRLVVLDLYEFSVIGYSNGDEVLEQAIKFVDGLTRSESPLAHRPTLNGGTTPAQLTWLRQQLTECRASNSKAIVCGHIPMLERVSTPTKVAWNAQEILDVFWSFSDVVLAYMSGHYHPGAMAVDKKGIHHITVPAIVETAPDSNSMVTFEVYEDSLRLIVGESPWG